ncbi:hypothetical protein BU15DRAFT_68655 [Melanogaster broomeanus]|nr:hypothetical protein BU15DRAFT_68655 [Melanogaster broomeanus]
MKLTAAPTIPTSRLRPNLIPLPNHASGNPRHNSSSPNAVVRRIHQRTVPETAQTTDKHGRVFNRAILEGLARVGFRMNLAHHRQRHQNQERASIQWFTENGFKFADGTELEADVIVFAMGYDYPRDSMREICSPDVANQVLLSTVVLIETTLELPWNRESVRSTDLQLHWGHFGSSSNVIKMALTNWGLSTAYKRLELSVVSPVTLRKHCKVGDSITKKFRTR